MALSVWQGLLALVQLLVMIIVLVLGFAVALLCSPKTLAGFGVSSGTVFDLVNKQSLVSVVAGAATLLVSGITLGGRGVMRAEDERELMGVS